MEPSSENTIAIVCGPPIMIKFTFPELMKLGFTPETIYTTLENRMKCGVGKCGRCTVGPVYVCKDGPVFTYKQLQELPAEY
jgi:NAD(P)H-flavin reductase